MPARNRPTYCPRCGGNLEERNSKYGKFLGCENYPDCTYTWPGRKKGGGNRKSSQSNYKKSSQRSRKSKVDMVLDSLDDLKGMVRDIANKIDTQSGDSNSQEESFFSEEDATNDWEKEPDYDAENEYFKGE
ncbi:topoisomerase DNA-binding C4 zinc finger domain-containing protein [Candidatus Woesearchaeota archaeon]|nr:topoisomerase DNA-binding C4 zinc finger domain-containing protein [Candidatus Woesearchaeota archaeon]